MQYQDLEWCQDMFQDGNGIFIRTSRNSSGSVPLPVGICDRISLGSGIRSRIYTALGAASRLFKWKPWYGIGISLSIWCKDLLQVLDQFRHLSGIGISSSTRMNSVILEEWLENSPRIDVGSELAFLTCPLQLKVTKVCVIFSKIRCLYPKVIKYLWNHLA